MFQWVSLDLDRREVVVSGCEVFYGSFLEGSLHFRQVKNPSYLKETESFEITCARDKEFKIPIARELVGLNVPQNLMSPGMVKDLSVVLWDYTVYAVTSYTMNFTPTNPLRSPEGAYIEIVFPSYVQFAEGCKML